MEHEVHVVDSMRFDGDPPPKGATGSPSEEEVLAALRFFSAVVPKSKGKTEGVEDA